MNPLALTDTIELAAAMTTVLRPLGRWPETMLEFLQQETAVVRVVIATLRGSAPREAGACMLVTRDAIAGTVGGGHLEWKAIADARALLDAAPGAARLKRYVLGIELGQCCGGVVEIVFERYDATDRSLLIAAATAMQTNTATVLESRCDGSTSVRTLRPAAHDESTRLIRDTNTKSFRLIERLEKPKTPLWLFGAGHVGQAIVKMLDDLPFALTWIDSRVELFPPSLSNGVKQLGPADPVTMIAKAPPSTRFLIMTHDHQLDYKLCRAILLREGHGFLGVIGSDSKAARFRSRLARDGIAADQLAHMTCPIGVAGIASKHPAAIAVAVVAQLLQGLGEPSTNRDVMTPIQSDDVCAASTANGCASCGQHKNHN